MQEQNTQALADQASSLLETGDFPQAKLLYEQICQANDSNADAWMMLGAINGELGDATAAVACLRKAIAVQPDFPEAYYNLSHLLRFQGDLEGASQSAQQAIALAPDYAEAWVALGGINGMLGMLDQAEDCCRRAITLQPDFPDAHMNLANTLAQQGKLEEALTSYQHVVQLQPGFPVAWFLMGRTCAQLGRFEQAAAHCRHAIALQPDFADAHLILGNALQSQNKPDEAVAAFRQVLQFDPHNAEAHGHLGMALHSLGQFDAAGISYRTALADHYPDSATIHLNLGILLQQQQRLEDAEASYREAVRIKPDFARAYANLADAVRHQGRPAEAVACFRQAILIEPQAAAIHYDLGSTLHGLGQLGEAQACYLKALECDPEHPEAHVALSTLYRTVGDFPAAQTHAREAVRLNPESADACHALATILSIEGRQDEALPLYERAVLSKPDHVDAYIGLGAALMTLDRAAEARVHCEQALRIDPQNIDAIALAANIADHTGDVEQAHKLLTPLLEAGLHHANVALVFASISKSINRQDEAIAMLEQLLATDPSQSVTGRRNLHFNLGKLYDAKGEYDSAFEHYRHGNALKPLSFDPQRHHLEMDSLMNIHNPEFMAGMPRATIRSERPVFIVGMVRSGTSLVEQILSSHPAMFGAGELPDIIQTVLSLHTVAGTEQHYPQCLPLLTQDKLDRLTHRYLEHLATLSPDAIRVIDKMPGNFMHLGLIELLFPDARIIHCMRDPMDTCLSAYFQDFSRSHPYSYDLNNLGAFYREYLRLMQHWREVLTLPMMEVQYEELVADQEAVSRRLVEFCGLDWDERCLEFHKAKRYVATASYDQVRQPLYKKSAGRWKHYERYLDPLKRALEGA